MWADIWNSQLYSEGFWLIFQVSKSIWKWEALFFIWNKRKKKRPYSQTHCQKTNIKISWSNQTRAFANHLLEVKLEACAVQENGRWDGWDPMNRPGPIETIITTELSYRNFRWWQNFKDMLLPLYWLKISGWKCQDLLNRISSVAIFKIIRILRSQWKIDGWRITEVFSP